MPPKRGLKVDICAAILSDKPPKLPLREELLSLGFEVVLTEPGTGIKAAKDEARDAVKRYRTSVQEKDLKKRRLFPKSPKRIKEKIAERQKIEGEIALPHACSYGTYESRLRRTDEDAENQNTSDSSFTHERNGASWGMFRRRQRQRKSQGRAPSVYHCDTPRPSFGLVSAEAAFPDFLAPLHNPSSASHATDQRRITADLQEQYLNAQQSDLRNSSSKTSAEIEESKLRNEIVNGLKDGSKDELKGGGKDELKKELPDKHEKPCADSTRMHVEQVRQRVGDEHIEKTSFPECDSKFQSVFAEDLVNKVHLDNERRKPERFFAESPLASGAATSRQQEFEEEKKEELLDTQSEAPKLVESAVASSKLFLPPTGKQKIADLERDQKIGRETSSIAESLEILKVAHKEPCEEGQNNMDAFEMATAEICQAVGVETTSVNLESPRRGIGGKRRSGWMSTAKNVFSNISTEVFKATGTENKNDQEITPSLVTKTQKSGDSVDSFFSTLFDTIARPDVSAEDIEPILSASPELPQVRQHKDGRLPLHTLCFRVMPDRSKAPVDVLTDMLLQDISGYKRLITIVYDFYPDACLTQDRTNDLPVHLMARRLMSWEATWYEKVYQKAAQERDSTGKTALAITNLYQIMSESIEMLLRPLVESDVQRVCLCQCPGSMGTILPLHIASIFTVSVRCLRLVLEAYPDGAKTNCDLGILQTFIPDESLPIELHGNLSTDFPKWEINNTKIESGFRASPQQLKVSNGMDDGEDSMRRSDLLFAYHPIEPHRFDKERIQRLEMRIQFDAAVMTSKPTKKLDRAHELLLTWMCVFREFDTQKPTYLNCVRRIASVLPLQSLHSLLLCEAECGRPLVDVATEESLRVLQKRIQRLESMEKNQSCLQASLTCAGIRCTDSNGTASVKKNGSAQGATQISTEGLAETQTEKKNLVGNLCRLVFNVPEMIYPTSFIILPYKLRKEEDGSLRLESQESVRIASRFAECLLNLTDPESILHVLDSKSTRHYGESIYGSTTDETLFLQRTARMYDYESAFLGLYDSRDGYLYLVDETTGLPVVNYEDNQFPIVLSTPSELVQKLLPLMMMGMVQMRGEKAIPKLVSIILDKNVAIVAPSWMLAVEQMIKLLDMQRVPSSANQTNLIETVKSLQAFQKNALISLRSCQRPKNGISEWNAELTLVKMLLEINDPARLADGGSLATMLCDDTAGLIQKADDVPLNKSTSEILQKSSNFKEEDAPALHDLSRKMKELSSLQDSVTGGFDRTSPDVLYKALVQSMNDQKFLDEEDHLFKKHKRSTDNEYVTTPPSTDASECSSQRSHLISRFSPIYDDLDTDDPTYDKRDDFESGLQIWNDVDRVWEEVTVQLNTRSERFREDSQIVQLKVALAEQARKLSDLGKKVTCLKAEESKLSSNAHELYDLTDIEEQNEAAQGIKSNSRKLQLRMDNLEERLVLDEIEIQHLSMEAYSVEHEGGAMIKQHGSSETDIRPDHVEARRHSECVARELSGISWGSPSDSEHSFLEYEKEPVQRHPAKTVRFGDITEVEGRPPQIPKKDVVTPHSILHVTGSGAESHVDSQTTVYASLDSSTDTDSVHYLMTTVFVPSEVSSESQGKQSSLAVASTSTVRPSLEGSDQAVALDDSAHDFQSTNLPDDSGMIRTIRVPSPIDDKEEINDRVIHARVDSPVEVPVLTAAMEIADALELARESTSFERTKPDSRIHQYSPPHADRRSEHHDDHFSASSSESSSIAPVVFENRSDDSDNPSPAPFILNFDQLQKGAPGNSLHLDCNQRDSSTGRSALGEGGLSFDKIYNKNDDAPSSKVDSHIPTYDLQTTNSNSSPKTSRRFERLLQARKRHFLPRLRNSASDSQAVEIAVVPEANSNNRHQRMRHQSSLLLTSSSMSSSSIALPSQTSLPHNFAPKSPVNSRESWRLDLGTTGGAAAPHPASITASQQQEELALEQEYSVTNGLSVASSSSVFRPTSSIAFAHGPNRDFSGLSTLGGTLSSSATGTQWSSKSNNNDTTLIEQHSSRVDFGGFGSADFSVALEETLARNVDSVIGKYTNQEDYHYGSSSSSYRSTTNEPRDQYSDLDELLNCDNEDTLFDEFDPYETASF